MDKVAKDNDHVKYLLIAVDLLSRFVRVEPMKFKRARDAKDAFEKMLRDDAIPVPSKLWIDEGTEFAGAFAQFCEDSGIHLYHTFTETKSSFAERYIRTLKSVIYKYMDANETYRYINHLQDFVKLLNSRENRMTKLAPVDVRIEHTEYLLTLQDLPDPKSSSASGLSLKPKFKVGQTVRVAYGKDPFNKGYKQSFSEEMYIITRISDKQQPITYWIQDTENRTIKRRFYEKQLVPYTYHESLRRSRHQRIVEHG